MPGGAGRDKRTRSAASPRSHKRGTEAVCGSAEGQDAAGRVGPAPRAPVEAETPLQSANRRTHICQLLCTQQINA